MNEKVSEFETKFGMIKTCGCIDGIHIPINIPIKCPLENSQDCFCYKQLQAVRQMYRLCAAIKACSWMQNVGAQGVCMTAKCLQIREKVMKSCEKIPNYLIGDPAYPLTPFCMK